MYYCYILRSQKDKKFYIGSSGDLKKRFLEHQNGKVQSTKSRRPLQLIFYEAFISKDDATRREHYFKSSKGKSSLRMMLRGTLQK